MPGASSRRMYIEFLIVFHRIIPACQGVRVRKHAGDHGLLARRPPLWLHDIDLNFI